LVVSSGAAIQGCRLSGGNAGAKRMLWIMADYANEVFKARNLRIHFQTIVPMQMVVGTGWVKLGSTLTSRHRYDPCSGLRVRFAWKTGISILKEFGS
jgi:hypothetical protein